MRCYIELIDAARGQCASAFQLLLQLFIDKITHWDDVVVLKRTELFVWWCGGQQKRLLGAGVLGDSFGSLGHGVLGQLTRQQQPDGRLDLSAGDGRPAVVVCKSGSLGSDALKDVIDERVHDGHGFAGHSGVGVHLLEYLVDVDGVRLPPPPLALLIPGAGGLCLRGGLLCSLRCGFGRHFGYCDVANDGRTTGEVSMARERI